MDLNWKPDWKRVAVINLCALQYLKLVGRVCTQLKNEKTHTVRASVTVQVQWKAMTALSFQMHHRTK